MNTKTTLAGLGLLAVTVGGLGVGTAYASTHTNPATAKTPHSAPANETPSATDTDNVQQGDQSGPDTAAPDTLTAGDTADNTTTTTADLTTAGDQADSATPTEKAGSEIAGSQTPDGSDGPSGYADTNTNADTQQEGQH